MTPRISHPFTSFRDTPEKWRALTAILPQLGRQISKEELEV